MTQPPQYIFYIPTSTFIVPHFQVMGAYCTGHDIVIANDEKWFNQDSGAVQDNALTFLEEFCLAIPEVDCIDINNTIQTPFIPMRDLNKCCDGYGSMVDIELPDTEKRGLRNKKIEKFFANRIKTIKRIRPEKWKLNVQFQHNKKTSLQKKQVKTYPAFTGLGILLKNKLSAESQDTILTQARMYAFENEFDILPNWSIKPFDSLHLDSIN